MAICWGRLSSWLSACAVYCVPYPFGVWNRIWNSIVSVPDHFLFIYFVNICADMFITVSELAHESQSLRCSYT